MTSSSMDGLLEKTTETNSHSLRNLQADSIDGVISSLDKIVEWSIVNEKKTGYFAALYRKVTIKVKEGIESGAFENAKRMEKLDVIFANRYLQAFEQYISSDSMSKSWKLAFDLSEKWEPIVLQHLMIGMNAHINLDLGIAAAQTVPAENISELKNDFDKINGLLASLVNEVQAELAEIWPLFRLIDKWAGKSDEALADFGMNIARGEAWRLALKFTKANSSMQQQILQDTDCAVNLMGTLLAKPGLRLRLVLLLIRLGERKKTSEIIKILS